MATTTSSVRDRAPKTPTCVPTETNPASTSGAPQQRHQPPAHVILPAPPSPTVGNHVAHLQQTGIMALVEQVEHIAKVVQPALPLTTTMDDFTLGVVIATVSALQHQGSRAPRRACAPPVLKRSTTMVQAGDMAGTTRLTGVGRSARVCCSRARSSMRLSQGSWSTSLALSSMAAGSRKSCWRSRCSPL